jgi:hypothetical protein
MLRSRLIVRKSRDAIAGPEHTTGWRQSKASLIPRLSLLAFSLILLLFLSSEDLLQGAAHAFGRLAGGFDPLPSKAADPFADSANAHPEILR